MQDPEALTLARDSVRSALERMHATGRTGLHVLDDDGRIRGLVMYPDVAENPEGEADLGPLLREDYLTT